MKKRILVGISLIGACLLSSCDNEWSWWKEKNVTIEKYASKDEAVAAFDSSAENYTKIDTAQSKEKHNTYFKDYLGKFATEVDSNITISSKGTAKRYNNNVIHINEKSNYENDYLNARLVDTVEKNTYKIFDPTTRNMRIREIVARDNSTTGSEEEFTIEEEYYNSFTSLGYPYSSAIIDWDSAVYGRAKNNQILVETMDVVNNTYTVHFNGNTLNIVTNIYTLYRFNTFNDDNGATQYYVDYYYVKAETMVGTNIHGEPLKEPYLLEKREASVNYSIKDNGTFDLNSMPALP